MTNRKTNPPGKSRGKAANRQSQRVLTLTSVSGDPLAERDPSNQVVWHILTVTYTEANGTTPVPNVPLTWSCDNPQIWFAMTTGSQTDGNGVAANAVVTNVGNNLFFTVTVSAGGSNDTQSITLNFVPSSAKLPWARSMQISSTGGGTLTQGQPHQLSVKYTDGNGNSMPDGTPVTWWAAPSWRLTFSNPSGGGTGNVSAVTGSQGIATIDVTASAGHDIEAAAFATTGLIDNNQFNPTVDVSGWTSLAVAFRSGKQGEGDLVITPQEAPPLDLGNPYPIDGTYFIGQLPWSPVTWVEWSTVPPEIPGYVVTFDPNPSPADLGIRMAATTQMTVVGPDNPITITVTGQTTDPNPANLIQGTAPITFEASGLPDAIVVNADSSSIPLYAPFTLTAQHTGTQETVANVEWSVDPGRDSAHSFKFDPPLSSLTGNGGTTGTTQITALGPNADVTVMVYARPNPPDPKVKLVPKMLTFTQQGSVPAGAVLNVVSVDGDPLQDGGDYHLFTASYTNKNRTKATTPGWDGTITWGPLNDPNVTWAQTDPTPTDANGIATNALKGQSAGGVTVTVQASGTSDTDSLPVTLADDAALSGQGTMTIIPPSGTPTLDVPWRFNARYLVGKNNPVPDGTLVTWYGSPQDRLTFSGGSGGGTGNTSYTTGFGLATIYVTASDGPEISTAVIATMGRFNPKTGFPDHSTPDVTVSFQAAQHGIVVSGPSSIPLYQGQQLTATNENAGDNVTTVVWSTDPDPDYTFTFSPNLSTMTGTTATTTVTAYGPNTTTSVNVYARSANPQVFPPLKPLNVTFTAVSPGDVPQSGVMDVDSLDGNPVAINRVHPVQATYTKADGTPYRGVSVNWSAPGLTLSLPNPTTTGPDGTTTNGISTNAPKSNVTVTASATNPDTNQPESGSKTLNVQISVPPLSNAGIMRITPPPGTLTVGQPYTFFVQYYTDQKGTLAPDGTTVTWYGLPEDRLTFSGGSGNGTGNTSYTTGGNGVATIQVTASRDGALPTAVIAARGIFNANTGTYDHSDPDATASFQAAPQADEIVVSSASDTPPLFAPYPLTAQHTGTQETVTKVVWSVDQGQDTTHSFRFDPPDSDLTGNGGTTGTTQITGLGANTDVTVTVYARPKPPDPKVKLVPKTLTFKKQPDVPAGAVLTVVSVGKDPLQAGDDWHVFQAAYLNTDGTRATTPGWDGTITWGPLNDQNDTWAQNTPTPADANGIATNALQRETPGDVTVTVQATGTSDTDSLTVTFSDDAHQSGQGTMTITPPSGTLTVGQPYTFSVQYWDGSGNLVPNGTLVIWTGFPETRLTFSGGSGGGTGNTSYTTGGTGVATIQVTASDGPAIPIAVIATTGLFNPITGITDHSDPDATVGFQAASQVGLSGVQIDKPYARTPDTGTVVPTYLPQVIKGQVQLSGNDNGGKTVYLSTVPQLNILNWVQMFDNNGNPLPLDTSTSIYQYVATTDPEGVAPFRVGSNRLAILSLTANMPGQTDGPSTQLALALVSDDIASSQLRPPTVPELQLSNPPNLPIQAGKPGFKVVIPVSTMAQSPYSAVLLLNDRIMWKGTVGGQPAGGIDVAYAALKATGNVLVYLVGQPDGTVRESPQPASKPFSAGPIANAQTGPLSGLTRSLGAPVVKVTGATIGPGDIVNGLPVIIPPYPANIGDQITIYVYLAGTDALTQSAVKNICILPYTLAAGDPLLSNKPQPMPIPQAYLAGLGQGTLQMDYKVVTQTTTTWSGPAKTPDGQSTTFTLNATF